MRILYGRRGFDLLRLARACQWLPAAPLKKPSALKAFRREAELLPILGLVGYARGGEYLMPSPQGYEFLSGTDQTCQPLTKHPYAQSLTLRHRLEVGIILSTCIGAGIEPALGKIEHLKRQLVSFPAFVLRDAGGNLMNAAGCAGFGHWGSIAYMMLHVSVQNTGFVITNELGHLHNLASVLSGALDTPQALTLAGRSYQSVYEALTKKTLSKRYGKKDSVNYSEAYQKLSVPAYTVSCDNTGVVRLAVMRQINCRARITQAAFDTRWDSKDDGIPEADGHADRSPLAAAVGTGLRHLDRVYTAAVRQGQKEIMVTVPEGQMSGLLFSILSKSALVRFLRVSAQVLSVTFDRDRKIGGPRSGAPLTLKGGFVHVWVLKKAGEAGRPHCQALGKEAESVSKQA